MITIQQLNKNLLSKYIYSEEFSKLKNIPISKHRALSHINNPRADDDDVLLLLAFEDDQLVGYLGILPDKIYHNNKFEKCGWLSCLWIDDEYRGKQIAYKLVQKSIEVWNNKILVTEFTAPAKKLYDKTNSFVQLEEKNGVRFYLRLNLQEILPPKKNIFKKVLPILKTVDFVANAILDFRFYFFSNQLQHIQLEYINHIDTEVDEFIKSKQQKQLFKRDEKELNWMIKNPWILSAPSKDINSQKYHFSSLDKSFEFVSIKILNQYNELIAFLIFGKRNENLKLHYCYYDNLEAVIKVINYHLVKWRIKTFTTFNKSIALELKNSKTPSLYKKEVKRKYIISSAFDIDLLEENFEIQDGDADCSFT